MRSKRGRDVQPTEDLKGDPTYVYERTEDHSFLAKASYVIERYRLIWIPFFAFLLALGFDFKTPAQTKKDIQLQIDSLKVDLGRTRARTDSVNRKLDILLNFKCLEPNVTPRDRFLTGLDCSRVQGATVGK